MAEVKTKPTNVSVEPFLERVEHPVRRADGHAVCAMMERVTGQPAVMWGPSIVGFGSYHYRYESGREGDWFLAGFSPRKKELTVYVMAGFEGAEEILARLGRHKVGKSCLYLRSLADVDLAALEELVRRSVEEIGRRYPPT